MNYFTPSIRGRIRQKRFISTFFQYRCSPAYLNFKTAVKLPIFYVYTNFAVCETQLAQTTLCFHKITIILHRKKSINAVVFYSFCTPTNGISWPVIRSVSRRIS